MTRKKKYNKKKQGYTPQEVALDLKQFNTIGEILCHAVVSTTTFSYLSYGCSRVVFKFKHYPYVLKIMREKPYHECANESEVRNVKKYGTLRLPKVFAFDKKRYDWIISEYVPIRTLSKEKLERHPDYMNLYKWATQKDLWDLHYNNVRQRTKNGNLVLVDSVSSSE